MEAAILAPQGNFFRRTFASLHYRNFRLFFLGQIVSNSGNWLTMVALVLLVLDRTDSGVAVGLLSACQFAPILLFSAWGGVLVDRFNKRRLLYITQSLEMAQSFVLAGLAFMHEAPLILFYLAAIAGGCFLAIDNPVRRSMVNEMVPADDVPNAVTLYSAMINFSRIVGPLIAGVLVVSVGYGWCFTLDALSYITVLVSLSMMRASELRQLPITPRAPGQIRAGLRYIVSVPDLWIPFAMLLIIGTISYNFSVVLPLFIVKGLHESKSAYTYVYAAFSTGGLLGALLVARSIDCRDPHRRDGRGRVGQRHARAVGIAERGVRRLRGSRGRRLQRRLHDGNDLDRTAAREPGHDRPGAVDPDGVAHRHDADRRPDPRLARRLGGPALPDLPRRSGRTVCRRLRSARRAARRPRWREARTRRRRARGELDVSLTRGRRSTPPRMQMPRRQRRPCPCS